MPRPTCPRRVSYVPRVIYFKPAGIQMRNLQEVVLGKDEMEAIRLKDLLGLSQDEAAREMNVSQPTFHRLIVTARQKMADAFVNGKAVRIEGGNVEVTGEFTQPCRFRHRWGCRAQDKDPAGLVAARVTTEGGPMKIAITSMDGTPEGMVDERFGRARKVVVYDAGTMVYETIDNTPNMNSPQGAGIQTAQNVAQSGATVVISGHLGPNAFRVLQTAGIEAYTATHMTVKEALQAFREGKLPKLAGADVQGHW